MKRLGQYPSASAMGRSRVLAHMLLLTMTNSRCLAAPSSPSGIPDAPAVAAELPGAQERSTTGHRLTRDADDESYRRLGEETVPTAQLLSSDLR